MIPYKSKTLGEIPVKYLDKASLPSCVAKCEDIHTEKGIRNEEK